MSGFPPAAQVARLVGVYPLTGRNTGAPPSPSPDRPGRVTCGFRAGRSEWEKISRDSAHSGQHHRAGSGEADHCQASGQARNSRVFAPGRGKSHAGCKPTRLQHLTVPTRSGSTIKAFVKGFPTVRDNSAAKHKKV